MRAYRITQIALSHDGTLYPEGAVVVPEADNEGLTFVLEQRLEAGAAELADPADAPPPSSAFEVALEELVGHVIDLGRRAIAFLPLAEAEGPAGAAALAAALPRIEAGVELGDELRERFEALGDLVARAHAEAADVGGRDDSAGAVLEAGGDAGGQPPADPPAKPTDPPKPSSTARRGGAKGGKA